MGNNDFRTFKRGGEQKVIMPEAGLANLSTGTTRIRAQLERKPRRIGSDL